MPQSTYLLTLKCLARSTSDHFGHQTHGQNHRKSYMCCAQKQYQPLVVIGGR